MTTTTTPMATTPTTTPGPAPCAPDPVAGAAEAVRDAEAAAAQLAERRQSLGSRLSVAARREEGLRAAEERARERLAVIRHDLSLTTTTHASDEDEEGGALAGQATGLPLVERYVQRLDDEADELVAWSARLGAELAAVRAERAELEEQDARLATQQAQAQERLKAAHAALRAARHVQPLHDLCALLWDCSASGLLTLVDAVFDCEGRCTAWVCDGAVDYGGSSGRTWVIRDFGEARRLWPHLPDGWREQRSRVQACGRQTMPGDGLLTVPEVLDVLERFTRPTSYRLVGTPRDITVVPGDRHIYCDAMTIRA